MTETEQLLRKYVTDNSEAAFKELVERYINLVYSVALRQVDQNSQAAEDVCQQVFTDLARKASSLSPQVQLGGWLHRHTCFTAATMMRTERRRLAREKVAVEMNSLEHEPTWNQLAPILEDAINELKEEDRQAIVLRFYEKYDYRSVAKALQISDDAAQKRVARALDKLRALVVKRSVACTTTVLGALLANEAIQAAPVGLAAKISSISFAADRTTAPLAARSIAVKLLFVVSVISFFIGGATLWKGRDARVASPAATFSAPARKTQSASTNDYSSSQGNVPGPSSDIVNSSVPTNSEPSSVEANTLRLEIVTKDSGDPIPNVAIDCLIERNEFSRKTLSANRLGICRIPIEDDLKSIELTTQVEGFADTKLRWYPGRGELMPTNYVLRLDRGIPIGGIVLGPDNEPVAGATIEWSRMEEVVPEDDVESHNVTYIETKSGPDGRWHMQRLAPEMLPSYYGVASHPKYLRLNTERIGKEQALEQQLKTETHEFRLNKALSIHGKVLDPNGKPVERAKITLGNRGFVESRSARSRSDGTFTIDGCSKGRKTLTAEAKGFAATTIPVEIKADGENFIVHLKIGKVVRFRIVKEDGQGIPKANIWFDNFSMDRLRAAEEENAPVQSQAEYHGTTDVDGRAIWKNAPDEELVFNFAADNFQTINEYKLRPNNEEHVITMHPALVISGTVRDAVTGKPIPRFRVICGWPGQFQPVWSGFERNWLTFSGGKFRHTFSEPILHAVPNPGYVLKFEAEGYTSYVTRNIAADEKEAVFDIALNPSTTTYVTALLPDGTPAALADVGFVAPEAQLQLGIGHFSRENIQNAGYLRTADTKGQFRLLNDDLVTRVVVAHPEGYAEESVAVLANTGTIQLQPWGRLEGNYTSGGKPAAGRELMIGLETEEDSSFEFNFSDRVKTDAQGHFVFSKLPPGKHKLIYLAHRQISKRSGSFSHEILQDIEIRPGETTTVDVGGSGYSIKMRFQYPPTFKLSDNGTLITQVHTPFPNLPGSITNDAAAIEAWAASPDGQAFKQAFRSFTFSSGENGEWIAENVPPGTYVAEVMALNFEKGETASHAGAKVDVNIPSDPPTGTIDLGEIQLSLEPNKQ